MSNILDNLQNNETINFVEFFDVSEGRMGLIVTFLAILELVKESLIEILQNKVDSAIYLQLKKKSKASNVLVTKGKDGAILIHKNKIFECPGFANNVVDKIGAGDAMLALISCSLKSGFDPDLSLFIGSLAAAQSVETIGNSVPVDKLKLIKTFRHALK